ncbi:efflux RND transporter periplasmic adaptor subunit [Xanthomonas sp. NCPPB 2654]|uniref:efflux RND transporter periplasmic adaptor subunit n=1 Tax=unclassified Xanthomonas TaxID=2643310 RepID=UPI0021E06C21|nr:MULTISPECIES: efflux RND transporter periplasmic adaptor subunit [unclassified Xanthomonas]MDL5367136.1 efflux RND transporter periplasmic adaptor subunit [Xanthomonas sp. NCPPB 2654]UYC21069.1 efflux RND transporter periplasmic adaptor subunit [Xanthomonas sp. CFBP 8443]
MSTSADLLKELRIDRKAPPSAPPSRRGLWIAVVLVLLLALGVGGWLLFGRGKAIEVTTAPVVAIAAGSSSASVLDASGYVVARRMATVSAKITGKVREVLIEEGMRVEQGQVMATLDPIDAGAQRQLSASQLDAARSQVANMQAQLRQAEADAQRLQTLSTQQLVSRSQYEQALSQRDALRAQLQSAQRNVVVAGNQLSISDLNVDNTIVRAPFSGVVTAKAAQPGEIVSPLSAGGGFTRTGIGTVVDMDSLEIEVEVGEAFIGRVKPGMPVEATLNAYPEWKIPAEVIAIIPSADRGKATVKVRVALKQKDPRIVPEMGVRVSFLEAPQAQAQDKPQGVRVPGTAIVKRDGQDVAFALKEDNTVERRALKTGIALGDDRQVLSGLAAGDTVVLDPPETVRDGVKVKMAEATEQ